MKKVDVHIGRFGNYDNQMHEQCITSLIPFDDLLSINFIDNVSPLKEARLVGYDTGECDYICHVDNDDYVLPGGFEVCLDELEKDNSLVGAYTNSFILDPSKNSKRQFYDEKIVWSRDYHMTVEIPIHQLCLLRRSIFNKVKQEYRTFGEEFRTEQYLFTLMAQHGDFKFLGKKYGYVWRKFKHGHHTLHDKQPQHRQHLQNFKNTVLGNQCK
jgi:hypothetical protein